MPSCKACLSSFEVFTEDKDFLFKVSPKFDDKKYAVPEPTLCPDCRQQRRAAFRNERNLYQRKCDFSGKNIISIYSQDKLFKIYDQEIWWGDKWDPLAYGREFDFTKTFFEQFENLMSVVPRLSMFNKGSDNSAYTNHGVYNKNCYMGFNIGYCEDVLYSGDVVVKCKNCVDLTNVFESELLYSCTDGKNLYNSSNLILSGNCSDSAFLYDCRGCSNCFMCFNLRNKSYCIGNKQYSKEEYLQQISHYGLGNFEQYRSLVISLNEKILNDAIHSHIQSGQSENVCGNFIFNAKNIFKSFDVQESEDLRYAYDAFDIKDCMDVYQTMDKAQLHYETHASSVSIFALFCNISHENSEIFYTDHCFNSKNLFGCVGLKRQEYCILNKKYSRQEYVHLVPRIIEHMQKTGEWGEFFPMTLSPYAYNEAFAQEYFPLTNQEALNKGCKWHDAENNERKMEYHEGSYDITKIPDDRQELVLACKYCAKFYRVIPQELSFYKNFNLPLPERCPDCRHRQRLGLRNPRMLFPRDCNKCGMQIETSYSPERKEKVYCEKCYLASVY